MTSGSNEDRRKAIQRLWDLIQDIRISFLTTVSADGSLHCRPMTAHRKGEGEFDGQLWYLTRASSGKIDELDRNHQVSLGFARPQDNSYIAASGTAELVSDREIIRQLWDPNYQSWFPEGPDDPDLALLRVQITRAEYWDAPSTTSPLIAGFVSNAPEFRDDPEYHARVILDES